MKSVVFHSGSSSWHLLGFLDSSSWLRTIGPHGPVAALVWTPLQLEDGGQQLLPGVTIDGVLSGVLSMEVRLGVPSYSTAPGGDVSHHPTPCDSWSRNLFFLVV